MNFENCLLNFLNSFYNYIIQRKKKNYSKLYLIYVIVRIRY